MKKYKPVASGRYTVYKKTIDWGAVFGAIFWIVIIAALVNSCST